MLWQMKREEHLILKKMKIEEEYDDVPCFSTYVRPRHHRHQKHATESHLRRGGQRPRISPGSSAHWNRGHERHWLKCWEYPPGNRACRISVPADLLYDGVMGDHNHPLIQALTELAVLRMCNRTSILSAAMNWIQRAQENSGLIIS